MARKSNRKQQRTPQQQKAARDNQRFIRELYGKRFPQLADANDLALRATLNYWERS